MRRADEIAAEEVARLRSEIDSLNKSHRDEIERLCFAAVRIFLPDGKVRIDPRLALGSVIADLSETFGMGHRAGELIAHWGGKFADRDYTRRSAKTFRMIDELHRKGVDNRTPGGSEQKRVKQQIEVLRTNERDDLASLTLEGGGNAEEA
ncbi:hypothetical protein QR64_00390 [Rhodococcus sp. Chr-9]|nr:hypothetical protein QR64_00390 [Rhodococcus sp. Chr-9]